jgi:uncharacterized surface protein with fasciclin (FAS1) repeats
MNRAGIAGLTAGAAMMIGGALGAVSPDSRPAADTNSEVMNPVVGGQAMLPDRDLMANIANSPLHTRLVTALKESGIAGAIKENGQFTLFAPTDAAFVTQDSEKSNGVNKAGLARRMSYLIVPGNYDSQALLRVINEGGGEARLRTLEGGVLTARMNGPTNIMLIDERGNTADIAIYGIHDRNGVIQVIDRTMEPGAPARQVASK